MDERVLHRPDLEGAAEACFLCPRLCGAPRTPAHPGWCGADEGFTDFRVASSMPHFGEERMISGTKGSGTVFFSGCSLKCCFCQNYTISHLGEGERLSPGQLLEKISWLLDCGVHNLNLVTPSHYADRLPGLFRQLHETAIWQKRPVPLIWNSSAYETKASLQGLAGLVDVFLVDLKFHDPELAEDLTAAAAYPAIAFTALQEMLSQQPKPVFDKTGLIQCGVVIRHLVMPGCWQDSFLIIDELARLVPLETPLSLLGQYRPPFQGACPRRPQLDHRLSRLEYYKVLEYARSSGFTRILSQ